MVTKINFTEIKGKKPLDAIQYIQGLEKGLVKDVLTIDLFNVKFLHMPFADTLYNDLYPRGIYMFFDKNDKIRYVGESNSGFFGRLMRQMDTTPGGDWAGNIMLIKMGVERTGKPYTELKEEDHEVDWEIAKNYKLVLLEVSHDELNARELKWLEKVIMKTFDNSDNHRLLNTRIGDLPKADWDKTIESLVKE